jgi:hypothetical protein
MTSLARRAGLPWRLGRHDGRSLHPGTLERASHRLAAEIELSDQFVSLGSFQVPGDQLGPTLVTQVRLLLPFEFRRATAARSWSR